MGATLLSIEPEAEKLPEVWIDGCKSPKAVARMVLKCSGVYAGNTVQVACNVGVNPVVFESGLRDLGIPLQSDNQYDATRLMEKKPRKK